MSAQYSTSPVSPSIGSSPAGIDVGQHQLVGGVEGIEELAEQIARARVAVRLEEHDQAAAEALARRRQGGADLGRMVTVVADHHDAAGFAAHLEAAVDAAELASASRTVSKGTPSSVRDGERREGVERVVAAGQAQAQRAEQLAAAHDLESASPCRCTHRSRAT